MIKRKAPKDMSSSEFVDYVEAHLKKNLEDINGNVFDETVERETPRSAAMLFMVIFCWAINVLK